jgi:hypothetical protein
VTGRDARALYRYWRRNCVKESYPGELADLRAWRKRDEDVIDYMASSIQAWEDVAFEVSMSADPVVRATAERVAALQKEELARMLRR